MHRLSSSLRIALLTAATLCPVPLAAAEPPAFDSAALEFFEKQVRPILVARCYECHGAEAKPLRGGLRLDSRDLAIKGGDTGPAIIPGKAKESLLVDSINYGETYQMPPKSRLPAEEIAVLTKWVELGAPWPKEDRPVASGDKKLFDLQARKAAHWCWQPIQSPPPPAVKNATWPRQGLDHFILAKLESKGLSPAVPTDKRTLIRRAYFDLIGLPPTPAEVEAFVADDSPKAFEKVIDHLLDSVHFGERWARHWMDSARYAETYGHEFDYPIPYATHFRDYLIRAFNADVPYDQFVTEQIAGDLLATPRLHPTERYNESIIGTGFWYLGEAVHAPVDSRNDECGRIDNQIDVMTKTFLGVTVSCARCHDHKFDAISTKDFYSLSGVLKSSRRQEALLDPHSKIATATQEIKGGRTAAAKALHASLPNADEAAAEIFSRYLLAAREVLRNPQRPLAEVAAEQKLDVPLLERWVAALQEGKGKEPNQHHLLGPWVALVSAEPAAASAAIDAQRKQLQQQAERFSAEQSRSELFADFNGSTFTNWFVTGEAFGGQPTTAGEADLTSDFPLAARPGVADSGRFSKKLEGVLRSPTFTINHKHIWYRLKGKNTQVRLLIDNYFMIQFHQLLFGDVQFGIDSPDEFKWRVQGGDLSKYLGHRAHIEIIDHGDGFAAIDEIRFSDHAGPPNPINSLSLLPFANPAATSFDGLAAAYGRTIRDAITHWQNGTASSEETDLLNWGLRQRLFLTDEKEASLKQQFATARQQIAEKEQTIPPPIKVLAICDGTGQDDKVHIRGNYRTLGEGVPRHLLEALGGKAVAPDGTGSGRLELARQIVDPTNPLTARVFVNRLWHHLFGRGLVPSVDNMGVLGLPPSHPELLDHLATQFMRDGWSQKRLLRTLMLSATYQMASAPNTQATELDPQNILLHRQNIRRLEGEAIRDALLKISGRFDPTPFGPAVAVHLTPFMQGRGRPGGSGPLDGNGRRSLYTEVRRNFLSPMMLAFDTPIPFNAVGGRNASNVPAQALILMNDPLVIQQADVWAKRMLAATNGQAVEQRIAALYTDAFARLPSTAELQDATQFLRTQTETLGIPNDQSLNDPRPWADLCHVLINVKDFIYLQ